MDRQELNKRYGEFSNDIWSHFLGSEHSTNRKGATFLQWSERSKVARRAMRNYLAEHGAPKTNPFFWVKRFPEPRPTDYNGSNDLCRMAATGELVVALYKGVAGIYTRKEAEDFEMIIKREFKL